MAEQRGEHRHHDERADGARPDREPRVTHRHNGGDEEGLVAWRGGGAVSCGARAREGLRGVDRTDLGGKDDEEGLDERVRKARLYRGVGVWRFHRKRFLAGTRTTSRDASSAPDLLQKNSLFASTPPKLSFLLLHTTPGQRRQVSTPVVKRLLTLGPSGGCPRRLALRTGPPTLHVIM